MTTATRRPKTQTFEVEGLTRVEGEGSLRLVVKDGEVVEARLGIFEAPRYFERLVRGRTPDEVLDIVARICGICPVAYQMSAVHAFEDAAGIEIDPAVRALRRLLYCGEWIESHALHVYFLHAPDFLGYPSAIELARDHRVLVERALRLKKAGNHLVALVGGRPIHPVTVRVGGFYHVPTRSEMTALRSELTSALDVALETVTVVEGFEPPAFEREPRLVSLSHPTDYPMNEGRIVSTDGLDLAPTDWEDAFREDQVGWSNALQARTHAGEVYLLGPSSRITLAADRLHPRAAEALARTGLAGEIRRNPFRSIVARAVELVHATSEALDIIDDYRPPERPSVTVHAGTGCRCLGDRGTARPALPSLRARRDWSRGDCPDRAPDEPEPGRHRGRSVRLRAVRPAPAARRGDPPVRAAHPKLRPVHLVRDAFPRPARGAATVSVERRAVRLLVCGNGDRGDDGAPLEAVAGLLSGLPRHLLADLEVRRCEQLELEDLIELPGEMACVVVDTAVGLVPGAVVTIALTEVPGRDAATGPAARSSHILPIGQVIAIAELMRGCPLDGSLVAIGGEAFGFGPGLGRPVLAALPAFRAAIEAALIDAVTARSVHVA